MRLKSIGVVLAAVVMAAVTVPAMAADQTTGFVDVQKVFSDYKKTQASNTTLDALGKQLDAQLTAFSKHKLLDESDRKALLELAAKASPTDADKKQMESFGSKEQALEQELASIQSKSAPSDAEKARQKTLMDRVSAADASIAKMNEQFEKQFNDKKEELSKSIRDDIVKAIEAVAKSKNLTMVVDKIAVLYGGTDITQPVIDNLNKGK